MSRARGEAVSVRAFAFAAAALASVTPACGREVIPDPREAARAYSAAALRGDADAIYAMLTAESRQRFGKEGTRSLLRDSRAEIERAGRALGSPQAVVRAQAEIRFPDGETALLDIRNGRAEIGDTGTLPAAARTPARALADLRMALARRSYAALVRLLTAETRSALENDVRGLVEGLEEPEALEVMIDGDDARVDVPGGHSVRLRREAGVWRVRDFD